MVVNDFCFCIGGEISFPEERRATSLPSLAISPTLICGKLFNKLNTTKQSLTFRHSLF